MDLGRTVAMTWLVVGIGLTVLLGPFLGWRGWLWLGGHDLLCIVGVSHELWRKSPDFQERVRQLWKR